MLGIGPRALSMLGKGSATELPTRLIVSEDIMLGLSPTELDKKGKGGMPRLF